MSDKILIGDIVDLKEYLCDEHKEDIMYYIAVELLDINTPKARAEHIMDRIEYDVRLPYKKYVNLLSSIMLAGDRVCNLRDIISDYYKLIAVSVKLDIYANIVNSKKVCLTRKDN